MIDQTIVQFLLANDGTNQLERNLVALDPATVKVDGRSTRDVLSFLVKLSAQIRFYDLLNQPQGDWRPMLSMLTNGSEPLTEAEVDRLLSSRRDWPPHLALLMSFLKAFSHAQRDMNTLPARRLNFYYEDVLRLARRPAAADKVHVIFESRKNATPVLLQTGTLLDAGATAGGSALQYALDHSHVVSHAVVESIKSSYHDTDNAGRGMVFVAEDATQVATGGSWWPFGIPQLSTSVSLRQMQPASLGFAIAAPDLFLGEGFRRIDITVSLRSRKWFPTGLNLTSDVEISLTGEKGWILPDSLQTALIVLDVNPPQTPPTPQQLIDETREFAYTLAVSVSLTEAAGAVTAYNEGIHEQRLPTLLPVWRMIAKPASFRAQTLSEFSIKQVNIEVNATGLRNLVLQNDQALQPTDGTILPFGTNPRIGGNFYIGSAEAFSKSLTSFAVNLEWEDPPESFPEHYSGYDSPNVDENGDFKADVYLRARRQWLKLTPPSTSRTLFVTNNTRAISRIDISPSIFHSMTGGFSLDRLTSLPNLTRFDHSIKQGFARLVLTSPTRADVQNLPDIAPFEAFGHKTYVPVYTQRVIQMSQNPEAVPPVVLPNPPYTPALSSVSLDYTAGSTFTPEHPNEVGQMFLLDVFGSAKAVNADAITLVPKHESQGSLYIGLKDAEAPQMLSLLFQIEEGSAPGERLLSPGDISWSYLAGSGWRKIAPADVLEDRTEGFQVPGNQFG